MLRGRGSGSRLPPAPIGRLRERSATAKCRLPANLNRIPSMAEVPRYFPVHPGNSSRSQGKLEIDGRQVTQPAGGGSRYAGRRHDFLGLLGRGFPTESRSQGGWAGRRHDNLISEKAGLFFLIDPPPASASGCTPTSCLLRTLRIVGKLDRSDWPQDVPAPEEWPGGVLRALDVGLTSLDIKIHNKDCIKTVYQA
ncbi:coiled-coil-helix-coiled-coil-helix domain-containing protein 5 isoform X1 [Bubalus kerabau]|uniref:coiled-coil-helix-coiled-coil-helix domain-containing protein 5 isoform X1 n=1 Tax=Bubalus carabanensis TaxID=3119969 RepID=UPI00244E7807|nr:coiled-coil-helix-coiled-coil-helix domain-containing protein 5 isoform X1 [Bubalus carabanensis]